MYAFTLYSQIVHLDRASCWQFFGGHSNFKNLYIKSPKLECHPSCVMKNPFKVQTVHTIDRAQWREGLKNSYRPYIPNLFDYKS